MGMLQTLGIALGSLSLVTAPTNTIGHDTIGNLAASDAIVGAMVPQPPAHQRGSTVAGPVFFVGQAGIDSLCGGRGQVVACAAIGGGMMALPNSCQARFAGESYAAVVCHEKGHSLGWNHG